MSAEGFSIDVGDIVRRKDGTGYECEVVDKWWSGSNWYYRLRHTDGSSIAAVIWRQEMAILDSQPTGVYVNCEQWMMKRVSGPGEEQRIDE